MAGTDPYEIYLRLSDGDGTAVDDALTYLERDPWEFWSGFGKADLMRRLKQVPLSDQDRRRIEPILLNCVDAGRRYEFREACYLARVITTTDFRDELLDRLDSDEIMCARRACSMLLRLNQPRRRDVDRHAIQRHLLRAASLPRHTSGQVRPGQVRAVWSTEWGRELGLYANSEIDTPERFGARRLLATVPNAAARLAAGGRAPDS